MEKVLQKISLALPCISFVTVNGKNYVKSEVIFGIFTPDSPYYQFAQALLVACPFIAMLIIAAIIHFLLFKKLKERKLLSIIISLVVAIALVWCYLFLASIFMPSSFGLENC